MEVANWITAISTLFMAFATIAMAIIAGMALNSWKYEQKRQKLINLLELLNSYIQDLQYYEIESTIFSKQAQKAALNDIKNNDLISKQANSIDVELAEGFGSCVLAMKNWALEQELQYDKLNEINKSLHIYRIKVYEYVEAKIKFFIENNKHENILYGLDSEFIRQMDCIKKEIIPQREEVIRLINELKNMNKKLLK